MDVAVVGCRITENCNDQSDQRTSIAVKDERGLCFVQLVGPFAMIRS